MCLLSCLYSFIMSEVSITFLGATDTVTGSRFLITGPRSRVLIDCGMFQGLKKDRLKNWEPFAADPRSIDAVVLSHAHLDHCGFFASSSSGGLYWPNLFNPIHQRVIGCNT